MTGHITRAVLARFFRSADADEEGEWGYISSASDADGEEDEESMRIPGLQTATETETKVRMLGIDLRRTFPPHAVGRERTEGARDRSWALRRVVGEVGGVAVAAGRKSESEGGKDDGKEEEEEWGAGVLGQMEVVFLMAVVLGNWACAREWERICGLVLTCRKLVREQEGFFAGFLGVLGRQLAESESGDGGLWEMFGMEGGGGEGGEWLKGLLKGFRGILREELEDEEGEGVKKAMEEVVKWVQGVWGWEIGEGRDDIVRRGMLELEDGEMVEMDIGEEEYVEGDERGEWAPVVVEL